MIATNPWSKQAGRTILTIGLTFLASAIWQAPAFAQNDRAAAASGFRSLLAQGGRAGLSRVERKIGPAVRATLGELEARGITPLNARSRNVAALSNPLVRLDHSGGMHVYLAMNEQSPQAIGELRRLGVSVDIVNRDLGLVEARIPFDRIEDVAALDSVDEVMRPSYAVTRAGSVTTEGDAILTADALRAGLTVDGTGVNVGVLSAGALSIAASQGSGDLPGTVTEFGSCDLATWGATLCDEGTAMMEIVHDVAPGAALGFGAVATSLQFINRLDDLVNTFGADVVVDDIGFFDQPFFQDGSVAKAANAAGLNAVVVSAAGNSAQEHYEKNFKGTRFKGAALPSGSTVHDFGRAAGRRSDTSMNLRFQPGGILIVFLQWNDRFSRRKNQYKLYLTDKSGNALLVKSTKLAGHRKDPIEAIAVQWTGSSPLTTKLVIRKRRGDKRRLEMLFNTSGVAIKQYRVRNGSVFGHPAASRVLAVGAIDANDPDNNTIRSFSSRGNSRIFFPSRQNRRKPDVTGIDGVTTTGPGSFPVIFPGTSAAAPHVAGVAALLLELVPGATTSQVRQALRDSAVDLGPAGRDKNFGAGRVDADAAGTLLPTL